jgi:hypothetical protein
VQANRDILMGVKIYVGTNMNGGTALGAGAYTVWIF